LKRGRKKERKEEVSDPGEKKKGLRVAYPLETRGKRKKRKKRSIVLRPLETPGKKWEKKRREGTLVSQIQKG